MKKDTAQAMKPPLLLDTLRHIPRWEDEGILYVAFSGGLDSTCLLHAMAALRDFDAAKRSPRAPTVPKVLRALHVDHGLHPDSAQWAEHCRKSAAALGVDCTVLPVTVHEGGGGAGPEGEARRVRYAALEAMLGANDLLLTAHHRGDLVETVLLRLLRGAGVRGLSAMLPVRTLGRGQLCRPLLGYSRASLQAYAAQHHLRWIDDPGNEQQRFDRNHLRHTVLPLLRQRWPRYDEAIARAAAHQQQTAQLLYDLAEIDILPCLATSDGLLPYEPGPVLAVPPLLLLPRPRQYNLLRHWIALHKLPPPSSRRLSLLRQAIDTPTRNGTMYFTLGPATVRRYRQRLYLDLHPNTRPTESHPFDPQSGHIDFPHLGYRLTLIQTPAPGLSPQSLQSAPCTLRPRTGGERLRPTDHPHHRPLKKLLAENHIPPWERHRIPLLYIHNQLAAIPTLLTSHWCSTPTHGYQFELTTLPLTKPPQ